MNAPLAEYQERMRSAIEGLPQTPGDWLIDRRRSALARFNEIGFPHPRLEEWRYTSIEGLLKQQFIAPSAESDYSPIEVRKRFIREPVAGRLVFVDGVYQAGLSDCRHQGLEVSSLKSAMAQGDRRVLEAVGSLSGLGEDGFAALNLAGFRDGSVIRLREGVKLESPIELLHLTTAEVNGCSLPTRHLVLLEAGSGADLIERCLSLDDEAGYFTHLVYEISLAEGAELSHQRIQQESRHAYHLSDLYIALQGKASYRGVNASVGSAWSRTTLHSRFLGQDAECELDGLYLVGEGQLSDFHLDVDHLVPHCDSRENFKGILHGSGKAVFDGLIQVREQAQKSAAHLHNANLILSRRAEVDTKPQLLILADDVACSHGTTVGQLDTEALFYMRSRGLDEQQAKRLLCYGFVADVVDRFGSEELREQLNEKIGSEL